MNEQGTRESLVDWSMQPGVLGHTGLLAHFVGVGRLLLTQRSLFYKRH